MMTRALLLTAIAIAAQLTLCSVSFAVSLDRAQPEMVFQYASSDRVADVAFAAHAPVLAVNTDGGIDIWNTRTWALERVIPAGLDENRRRFNTKAVAVSPDGAKVAFVTGEGEVQLWQVRSGQLVKRLPNPVGMPYGVSWSPDGRLIAAGGNVVRIWDARTGMLLRTFQWAGDVAFSGDSRTLGIAGYVGFKNYRGAALFAVSTGRLVRSLRDKSDVTGPIALSPDGRLVATGGEDPKWRAPEGALTEAAYAHELKVKIWNRRTGKLIRMLPGHNSLSGATQVLQFTPDSRRLFIGGEWYSALRNVTTSKATRLLENEDASAISPDGKLMAITAQGVAIHSVATGKRIATLRQPPPDVRSVAFSPDGSLVGAADQYLDGTGLRLWNVRSGRLARGLEGPPSDLGYTGFLDGGKVYVTSLNGTRIWDTSSGKLLRSLEGPKERTFSGYEHRWTLLTPDGSKTVAESGESAFHKSYQVRNAATGKLISTIPAGLGWLADVAFSPDGHYMATSARGRTPDEPDTTTVWDIDSGKTISTLEGGRQGSAVLFFSPDGKTVAAAVADIVRTPDQVRWGDNRIVIWDTRSGKMIRQTTLDDKRATALAFSPDGKTIAAATGETIRIYDLGTLELIASLTGADKRIAAVAYSPDGSRIAAGGGEGRVWLWDVKASKLLITFVALPSSGGNTVSQNWYACTPDGFSDWSPGASSILRWRINGKLHPVATLAKQLRRTRLLEPISSNSSE